MDIKKTIKRTLVYIVFVIVITVVVMFMMRSNLVPKEYYQASDFNIKTLYSSVDYNKNNIDDYTDIVLGARKDANNHPFYISKYYEDAYPPDNEGVCTDVIWRAFKKAGYSLRDMLDKDIEKYPEDYQSIKKRDKNIDFRRVRNLSDFFKKYAISLTLDYKEIEEWQPGDIVIFGENKHIGIVSDRRNSDGITYIIHNGGQLNREEDYLNDSVKVTGHYRFDASLIDKEVLVAWKD